MDAITVCATCERCTCASARERERRTDCTHRSSSATWSRSKSWRNSMRYSSESRRRTADSLPSLKMGTLNAAGVNGVAAGLSANILALSLEFLPRRTKAGKVDAGCIALSGSPRALLIRQGVEMEVGGTHTTWYKSEITEFDRNVRSGRCQQATCYLLDFSTATMPHLKTRDQGKKFEKKRLFQRHFESGKLRSSRALHVRVDFLLVPRTVFLNSKYLYL